MLIGPLGSELKRFGGFTFMGAELVEDLVEGSKRLFGRRDGFANACLGSFEIRIAAGILIFREAEGGRQHTGSAGCLGSGFAETSDNFIDEGPPLEFSIERILEDVLPDAGIGPDLLFWGHAAGCRHRL